MAELFEDPRAHLQSRVRTFAGFTVVFFALALAADWSVPAPGEPIFSSTRVASLTALAVNAAGWWLMRRGSHPLALSRAVELGSVAMTTGALAVLPVVPPITGVGGALAIFIPVFITFVVLLRAGLIPSPPWLSALVALVAGSVATFFAVRGWEGIIVEVPAAYEGQGMRDHSDDFPVALGVFTSVGTAFVAAVISHVVYGLEAKVRAAQELGQYTLEEKLGEGGMGVVYKARHRMLRRPAALKLLPSTKAGERAVARFEREVQETTRLTHPNTVAIFDFGRTRQGVFFYVMEYLEGLSLQSLVDELGPLPEARAVHLLGQAADALAEAHALGLVHRDVKPDNLMLCRRGGVPDVVKVLDFGLVKDVEAGDPGLSQVDTVQGTPLYMAPEALASPERVDARADLYALGAVAHFLLTGAPVFSGSTIEVFGHHLHSAPTPLRQLAPDVSAELEALVLRCLAKDPGERPADAGELAAALRALPGPRWRRSDAEAWWADADAIVKRARARGRTPTSLTVAPRR
ncbi:MAG: serine/threonine-protein kinase [Myxococcota bacterium]